VINYLIEMRPDELDRLLGGNESKRSTLKGRLRQVKSRLAPSGWRKQNQTSYNRVIQDFAIAPFQGNRDQISPSAVRALETQFVEERDRKSPTTGFAAAVPNIFAMRTAVKNQVAMIADRLRAGALSWGQWHHRRRSRLFLHSSSSGSRSIGSAVNP
jgi:hypothetical protein